MPAPTLAEAQTELLTGRGLGDLLAFLNKDGTTVNSPNPYLLAPLREGLRFAGQSPAAFGTIADADLAGLDAAGAAVMFDAAELRALRTIVASPAFVNYTRSMESRQYGELRSGLSARIKELTATLRDQHGVGLAVLGVGSIETGSAEPLLPWDVGSF